MKHSNAYSATDKFALFSCTVLIAAMGMRFSATPEATTPASLDIPETGALIESRIPTQASVPLAQVLATQVQIERLMAAGMIKDEGLDQAFQLLERSNDSVNNFVSRKGLSSAEAASLKMIRSGSDVELYEQYQAMSELVEQAQAGQ